MGPQFPCSFVRTVNRTLSPSRRLICEAPSVSPASPGAAWGPDDVIIFAAGGSGLMRCDADSGVAEQITVDVARRCALSPDGQLGVARRARQPVADLSLDKTILQEARRKTGEVGAAARVLLKIVAGAVARDFMSSRGWGPW